MNQRPNIIVITTDQQRTDSLTCYGSTWMRTPHLQRLADEGIVFDRAYCNNPVCMPSRVSLFTGQMVSRHGVWNVGVNARPDQRMISHTLAEAGYRTHYIGKAHFEAFGGTPQQSRETLQDGGAQLAQPIEDFYGFQIAELAPGHSFWGTAGAYGAWLRTQATEGEWAEYSKTQCLSDKEFGGEAYDWPIPTRLHNSVWTGDRTVDFLNNHTNKEPFFLAVGFQDPHHPHAVPTDLENKVSPDAVPLPEYTEGELDDKPPHYMWARCGEIETSPIRGEYHVAGQAAGADFRPVTETDARLGRAYYYSLVQLIDSQVGRILQALEANGLAENTIIVFTTDHGELLGDHGLWMKGPFHYEQLIRVPLLMRWPQGFAGGQRINHLWSHLDLVPTLLDFAGVETTDPIDGISAAELFHGKTVPTRESVLVECIDDPRGLRLKTLVTENRKFTWYAGENFGELYDLETDPEEKVNLWHEPNYAEDKATLFAMVLNSMEGIEERLPRHCYA